MASSLANLLLGSVALVPTSCNSCHILCSNNLSKISLTAGVQWRISRFNCSIAFWQLALNQVVPACRALFKRTWNCVRFVVETFSAPYTRASTAAQFLETFCSHNWWDSLANRSFTLAFADFDIFCTRKIPFFWQNCVNASSSTLRDRSEWFCWLRSRENSHNVRTAPFTISSETFSTVVFPASWERSIIEAQFTASVLIIPRISLPSQVPLFNESNGFDCSIHTVCTLIRVWPNLKLPFPIRTSWQDGRAPTCYPSSPVIKENQTSVHD